MASDAWRDRIPSWVPRVVAAIAVIAVVVVSAIRRWQILDASPFPVGIDGYFYPIQLRSLLETGHLQYPASPFALWFMVPFAAATDPITGAKLGAAIGGAMIAIPAYLVGARVGNGRGPGFVAASLAATSMGSTYLSVEFVKNGIGLSVGLFATWLALRALDQRTRARIALAVIGLVATWLTHKMAAAFLVILVAPAIVVVYRAKWRMLLGIVAGIAAIAIVVGIAAPQRFVSPDDLGLIADLFSPIPRWNAPALESGNVTLLMNHEAITGLVAAIVVAALLVIPRWIEPLRKWLGDPPPAHVRATAWAIVGLAILIGLPWLAVDDPQGLGFRLRLAAYVPLALCFAMLSRLMIGNLHALDADALLLAIAIGIVGRVPATTSIPGEVVAHPAMVSAVASLKIPAGKTAIVPERHIAFMVAWYTRAPVSIRPELAKERIYVLPLAFIGDGSALDTTLLAARREPTLDPPIGTHPRHPNGLVAIPDATWRWALDHLPPDERAYFARWPTL